MWEGRTQTYAISKIAHGYGVNRYLSALRNHGLMGCDALHKFIPSAYLYGSVSQRMALLHGLMDCDGYIAKDGTTQYGTSSLRLQQDVCVLVQSLGGIARVSSKIPTFTYKGSKKEGEHAYVLTLALPPRCPPAFCHEKHSGSIPASSMFRKEKLLT